jgi:dephospho-CoA kinase
MPILVAFAGFGGAGKTTAIKYLESRGLGRRVYLGQAVSSEINLRGLVQTPSVEREVRTELRAKLGPSAFADLGASTITEIMAVGECVLVDAIFNVEEYERLRDCGQPRSVLVAIEASFETRSARLLVRRERAYTSEELRERDQTEIDNLGTASVLKLAEFTVPNESSLVHFQGDLDTLWNRIVR